MKEGVIMKKLILLLTLGVIFVSCQSKGTSEAQKIDVETVVTDVYAGELPAADCSGIVYELVLNAESVQNVFSLNMTYLEGGSDGSDESINVRGRIINIVDNGKKVLKLQPVDGDVPMYFLQVNDSVLRMVNDSLQEIPNGLNYDLIKQK